MIYLSGAEQSWLYIILLVRVAEVVAQDIEIADGDQVTFRTKLKLSFKYEDG